MLRICIIGTFFNLSASDPALSEFDFILLVISTLFIAAGGYIINDIVDVKTDSTNKPHKTLIGKSIAHNRALRLYYILTFCGIIIGFYLAFRVNHPILGFVFVVIVFLLWFYSKKFQKKPLWGNIIIALLSSMVIVIVWLIEFFALLASPLIYAETINQLHTVSLMVGGYALFAFLVSLFREVMKDMEDMEGDKDQNYATLPVVIGLTRTKMIVIIIVIITITMLAICQYWLFLSNYMLVFWYLMVAVQTLLLFLLYQIFYAKTKEDFHFLSNASKIIMVAGILSMQIFYISF